MIVTTKIFQGPKTSELNCHIDIKVDYYQILITELVFFICQTLKSRDVVADVLECHIKVSEIKFQSHYCVPFQTNTLEKSINHLIPPVLDK